MSRQFNFFLALLLIIFPEFSKAQTFNIPGGPVSPGMTTCFPVNVFGVGTIFPPNWGPWSPYIDNITLNIQTTHPQTLSISLVSPSNDTLLLAAFNGNGGPNYTNTVFPYWGGANINSANPPFSGSYSTEGMPGLSKFDFTNADGTWYLCITDTLTDTTTTTLPGPYIGSFAGATIAFGVSAGPPPCLWTTMINSVSINKCPGEYVDLDSVFNFMTLGLPIVQWTLNGNPVANINNVTTPGVYNLYAADGMMCQVNVSVTVSFNPATSLGPDQTIAICNLTPVNLYSYLNLTSITAYWISNPLPNNPSNQVTPGTYTLIGTNTMTPGCFDTVLLTVVHQQPLGPSLTISQCGGTVDLTTLYNTTGMNVTWTLNGIPVANPSAVSTPGVYTIGALTASNCLLQSTVTLNISPVNLGINQAGSVCQGTTMDLTGVFNTAGLNSTWSYNNTPVLTPTSVTQPGIYTLIADDGNGCADTADFTLTVNTPPSLGPNQNVNVCSGTVVDLTTVFNLSGLNPVWTYGGNPVPNPSAVTLSGSYDVTVTDANGCTDYAQVMVAYSQALNLGSNQFVDFCDGTDVDLTTLFSTGLWTTQWQLNGINVPNPASVNTPGVYTIIATNSTGCTGSAQATLNQLTSPALPANQSVSTCYNTAVDLTALFNTTGMVTSWTYNSVASPAPVNALGWGYYTITATSTNGCSDSSTVFLDILPKPNLGNDHSYIYCTGNPTDLNSYFMLTGLNVSWTESGNPVTNTLVMTSGTYQIIATNSDGCSDTAIVQLQYDPAPSLGADINIVLCDGDSVDITSLYNTTGMNAVWTFNTQPLTSPGFVKVSGDYTLTATNGSNCADDATVHLIINPFVNPGPDQTVSLCSWMTANLNALFNLNGLNAVWTLNGNVVSNVSAVTDTGIYILNVSDANGCTATAQVTVIAVACRCAADFTSDAACTEMPSTFTIKADSAIVSAHWDFNGQAEDSYEISPSLKLAPSADSIPVTLITELTCGMDTVKHNIMVKECSMACQLYFPAAFTPNDDGLNEQYIPITDCTPENYDLKILNRFGQVVFATNNVSKGWDGNSENGSQNEVYVYKVNYKFPYQKEKTESGRLTLVR